MLCSLARQCAPRASTAASSPGRSDGSPPFASRVDRATLVVTPRFEPPLFLKAVQDYKVTVACMVPPMLVILDKEPTRGSYDLKSLRAVYCGAAPLDAATQGRIAGSFGVQVRQAYGTTETSPIISVAGVSPLTNKHGTVGRAVPNTLLRCCDDEKVLVPNSEGGGPLALTNAQASTPRPPRRSDRSPPRCLAPQSCASRARR